MPDNAASRMLLQVAYQTSGAASEVEPLGVHVDRNHRLHRPQDSPPLILANGFVRIVELEYVVDKRICSSAVAVVDGVDLLVIGLRIRDEGVMAGWTMPQIKQRRLEAPLDGSNSNRLPPTDFAKAFSHR